jgi:hypothetical protein
MFANQFFPAVTQTIAGLAVNVENRRMFVKEKESVSCVVHEGAKARFARAQLVLRLPQLRNVLQNAKLAHRLSRFVPRHVALAVDYSLGAIGADHPVFDVIAWTAWQQSSRSRLGCSRPVLGVNQVEPACVPFWQIDRIQSEDSGNLIRKRHAIGAEVPLPPAKMRDLLRLLQLGFTLA